MKTLLFVLALSTFAPAAAFIGDSSALAAQWSHNTVIAGTSVTVRVTDSDCWPITVTVIVNETVIGTGTINRPTDTVVVEIPETSVGDSFEIDVACGSWTDSSFGTVQ